MKNVALNECCRFLSGGTPSKSMPKFWEGEIPWFSPKDIKSFDLIDSMDHISELALRESSIQLLSEGAILVVARSGVLAHTLPVGVLRNPAAFNQDVKAILPNPGFDPEFVALFIKSQEQHVISTGVKRGATVHSLASGFIESLRIPLLEISDQVRIAADVKKQLAAVADARQAAEAQLREIKLLPQRLLAQVFDIEEEAVHA